MDFATKLRNLRLQRGLTQMELADKLSTSQSSITSWEMNRREPDFATIKRIANFFGVPMSSLLPSDDSIDSDYAGDIAEMLHANPKLRVLFEKAKFLSDHDLDVVISMASALSKES